MCHWIGGHWTAGQAVCRKHGCHRGKIPSHRLHAIAFDGLVVVMEDMVVYKDNALVFKLSDVVNLYKTRLEQLGATVTNRIHTTRLKDRLLAVLSDLRAHSQGRGWDQDTRFTFDGVLQAHSQKYSVTPSLLAQMNMILDVANIKHQTRLANTSTTTVVLILLQLLLFNSVKHAWSVESTSVRHSCKVLWVGFGVLSCGLDSFRVVILWIGVIYFKSKIYAQSPPVI